MNVKELITALQKYDPSTDVQVATEGVLCEIISIEQFNKTVVIEG